MDATFLLRAISEHLTGMFTSLGPLRAKSVTNPYCLGGGLGEPSVVAIATVRTHDGEEYAVQVTHLRKAPQADSRVAANALERAATICDGYDTEETREAAARIRRRKDG